MRWTPLNVEIYRGTVCILIGALVYRIGGSELMTRPSTFGLPPLFPPNSKWIAGVKLGTGYSVTRKEAGHYSVRYRSASRCLFEYGTQVNSSNLNKWV